MGRTHLFVGAGVVLSACLLLGCASKPKPAARHDLRAASRNVADARRTGTPPNDSVAPAGPQANKPVVTAGEVAPRSIAQHAEVYAQNLESLLAKRAGAGATGPAQPQQAPSAPSEPAAIIANSQLKVEPQEPQKAAPAEPARATAPASVKPDAAKDEAQPTAPAPRATPATKSPSVASVTDQLDQKLSTRVREYPRDTATQLEYQLLQFLRDEPVPELTSIASLPSEDRELLTALLDGLSNFRSGLRAEANMLQSKKVAPLLEMADRFRSLGELTVPTAVLCTKVDAFGVYEPMQPAQFTTGANNEAVLYCEVANFSSQLNSARQWETRLKHEAVVYNETGLNVWTAKADTVSDLSRNRRHDFYVVRRLRPPPLPVGRYLLKVTVTDLQMSRVAEATVPIQVVAPQ